MMMVSFSFATGYDVYCSNGTTCVKVLNVGDVIKQNTLYYKTNYMAYERFYSGSSVGFVFFNSDFSVKGAKLDSLFNVGDAFNCFTVVTSCPIGSVLNSDNICAVPSVPTCDFGYHNDTTKTGSPCIPDKQCPSTMRYFAKEVNWGFDLKICLPRQDLSPEDCANQGGAYATPVSPLGVSTLPGLSKIGSSAVSDLVTVMGKGCYDANYIKDLAADKAIGIALSFGTAKIDKEFLAQLKDSFFTAGKDLYAGGKKLSDYVKGFFNSDPAASNAGLIEYKPEFIDVKIQDDGTYATMDYKLRTEIMNELNGKPTVDLGTPNGEKIYEVSSPEIVPDNVYLGGDIHTFEANIIGTKSFLDEAKPIEAPETLQLNGVLNSTIDLKNSLFGVEKSSFPVSETLLQKNTLPTGEVQTLTRARINFPDGSYTTVDTLATKLADASKTYQITTKTPIMTNSGVKVYEQKVSATANSSGVITNKVSSPATISFVDSSGSVVSQTNSPASSTINTGTNQSPVNLSNLQNSLDKLNKQLSDLSDYIKDSPKNIGEFNTALNNFKVNMNDWSLSLDNAVNFISGFKDKFLGLENSLQDALSKFDNKPEVRLPSGQCPFQANWYGKTFMVDPCMFVSPYRPILVSFFTLWFSAIVFFFCIKFFFRVGE